MKKMLIVLLTLGFGFVATAQAQLGWWDHHTTTGTPPTPRKGHTMVLVPLVDSIFVFGGQDQTGLLNDLYALQATGWTPVWAQLLPRGTPPPQRSGHSMVLVSSRNRILVFGGYVPSGQCLNDVWALDSLATGGHWTQLTPAGTPPSRRAKHTAIYDSLFDRMIVYAGRDSASNPLGDLWALDSVSTGNGRWRQMSPSGTPPSARFDHTSAYDGFYGNNSMTVFGGRNSSGGLADLYSLSLTASQGAWSALNPGGQPPSARYGHVATYAYYFSGAMFLFGGQSDSTHFFSDTYSLRGQWYREPTGNSPAPRSQMPVIQGSRWYFWSILEIVGGTLGDSLANDLWSYHSGNAVEDRSDSQTREGNSRFSITPNPMRGTCTIIVLARKTQRISVYGLSGQLVRTLDPKASRDGVRFYWDGRDAQGKAVSEGVYFIRTGDAPLEIGKVVVLR
jgi:hypothetical protein